MLGKHFTIELSYMPVLQLVLWLRMMMDHEQIKNTFAQGSGGALL